MATFVPCASCYGSRPVPLFGMGHAGGYLSLLTYHGPTGAPRPRLTYHTPKMTLRQICRLIRIMRQVRNREAALASAARIPVAGVPTPASPVAKASEKRCLPACFRRRRSTNIKRVG